MNPETLQGMSLLQSMSLLICFYWCTTRNATTFKSGICFSLCRCPFWWKRYVLLVESWKWYRRHKHKPAAREASQPKAWSKLLCVLTGIFQRWWASTLKAFSCQLRYFLHGTTTPFPHVTKMKKKVPCHDGLSYFWIGDSSISAEFVQYVFKTWIK